MKRIVTIKFILIFRPVAQWKSSRLISDRSQVRSLPGQYDLSLKFQSSYYLWLYYPLFIKGMPARNEVEEITKSKFIK